MDIAQDTDHLFATIALANALHTQDALPPCGQCYNCQATVTAGHRFCDADCRDDHSRRTQCP